MFFRIQVHYRTSAFIRVEYISIQPYMFLSQTGDNKIIDKIRQRYYWLHLRGDVERF